jgi:hypothetical protein
VNDDERNASEVYLDRIFGDGAGAKHSRFLGHLESPALRDVLHGYHLLESDETHLSIEENYLLGMVVLLATKNFAPAAMFAKTLRHRGVAREKILEATTRLSMWIGGIAAAEAAVHVQRALREWDERGLDSMKGWFPEPPAEPAQAVAAKR